MVTWHPIVRQLILCSFGLSLGVDWRPTTSERTAGTRSGGRLAPALREAVASGPSAGFVVPAVGADRAGAYCSRPLAVGPRPLAAARFCAADRASPSGSRCGGDHRHDHSGDRAWRRRNSGVRGRRHSVRPKQLLPTPLSPPADAWDANLFFGLLAVMRMILVPRCPPRSDAPSMPALRKLVAARRNRPERTLGQDGQAGLGGRSHRPPC